MPLPAKWQIVHLNVSTPPFTASQCGLAWQLLTWKLLKVYQSLYSGQMSTYTVSHHGAFHAHCNKYNFPIKDKAVLYFPICQLAPRDACQAFPPPRAHPSRTNPPEKHIRGVRQADLSESVSQVGISSVTDQPLFSQPLAKANRDILEWLLCF